MLNNIMICMIASLVLAIVVALTFAAPFIGVPVLLSTIIGVVLYKKGIDLSDLF